MDSTQKNFRIKLNCDNETENHENANLLLNRVYVTVQTGVFCDI